MIKQLYENSKRPIVFFDLETTGLDPVNDRICSMALVKIMPDGERAEIGDLINPTIPIPAEMTAIHGISDADVLIQPTFKMVANEIKTFITGCDLAGYNIINFDLPMLLEEFGRVGIDVDLSGINLIDVMNIYKKLRPRTLSAAYLDYVGNARSGEHEAFADTYATIDVMGHILLKETVVGATPEEWMGFTVNRETMVDLAGKFIRDKSGAILFNFGPQKGNKVNENMGMLKWMYGKNFSRDTMRWVNLLTENPALASGSVLPKSDPDPLPFGEPSL